LLEAQAGWYIVFIDFDPVFSRDHLFRFSGHSVLLCRQITGSAFDAA
jgi:hypothetical protein